MEKKNDVRFGVIANEENGSYIAVIKKDDLTWFVSNDVYDTKENALAQIEYLVKSIVDKIDFGGNTVSAVKIQTSMSLNGDGII